MTRRFGFGLMFLLIACGEPRSEKTTLDFLQPYLDTMDAVFDEERAMETVRRLTRFHRLTGTPEYDNAVAIVMTGLNQAGYGSDSGFTASLESYPLDGPLAWRPISGKLKFSGRHGNSVITDFDSIPLMLCENSYPFKGPLTVVDVDSGEKEDDYLRKDLRGKIVLGLAPPAVLFYHAVKNRGAAGVISAHVPELNRPNESPDIVVQDMIPYSADIRSFGIKISPNQHRRLQETLKRGESRIEVDLVSEFIPGQLKVVTAQIQGTKKPQEHLVLIAHLDHYRPGANDNASGAAVLMELAQSARQAIVDGRLKAPERTIDFIWVSEYVNEFRSGGTGAWIRNHMETFKNTVAMISLDMVGENTKKTGGVCRIERFPDPAVRWSERYLETASGWGKEPIGEHLIRGTYLNDYLISVFTSRSRGRDWIFVSNPFEGGSDHVPFVEAGVPAVLTWHFPDRFYHSSLDDADKVDPAEMKNIGVSVGAAVFGLASLSYDQGAELLPLLETAAKQRFEVELTTAQKRIGSGFPRAVEEEVLNAWSTWYEEAVVSTERLIPDPKFRKLTDVSRDVVRDYAKTAIQQIAH